MKMNSKFVYALGSFAFAFMPPRGARALTVAAGLAGAGILVWAHQDPGVLIGAVSDMRQEGGSVLAAVQTLLADETAVLASAEALAGESLAVNDVLIAFGREAAVAPGMPQIFDATRVGVLPSGDIVSFLSDRRQIGFGYAPNQWGYLVLAVLLTALARPGLKGVAAAASACGFTLLAFLLLHVNAETSFLPVPSIAFAPLLLAAGVVGGAVAFKAMKGETLRLGERLAGVLLALPLMDFVVSERLAPAEAAYAFPALALAFPSMTIAGFAALMLREAVGLEPIETLAALGLLIAVRAAFALGYSERGSGKTVVPLTPDVDERGAFEITDLGRR